jgi:feruloyl-CoA synthase
MTKVLRDPARLFATVSAETVKRPDGALLVRCTQALGPAARCTGEYLEHWGEHAPDRPFLTERAANTRFRGVTYAQALGSVRRIAAWLLERELCAERPVVILSENSVEHGLLTLSCLHVGIPVAPVSPAYSLISKDFRKLRRVIQTLQPGVIFVGERARFDAALAAIDGLHDAEIVVGDGAATGDARTLGSLMAKRLGADAVASAFESIGPDTIAKFLFTSGSTDEPKAVINTHGMLCSNQQAIRQLWPFLAEPPVLVDWLPWHHTFGGNHNFNLVLKNGGTLYIDSGRPMPGRFDQSLANLREVAPTVFFNVPRAYDVLVAALRKDPALRERFFSRLQLLFYAAASLPQHLWTALQELAVETVGEMVPLVSSWGLTESAPAATSCYYQAECSGVVGLPVPGCELKLVPNADKLEARVRGPNVTPGYWKRPDLTRAFFDDEGFFKTGDALKFVDVARPELGLCFDGRLGEDFKLSTGTWVSVGNLRLAAIAALAPVAQDVVITGHDQDEIGFLIFPNLEGCRRLCGLSVASEVSDVSVLNQFAVRAHVARALSDLKAAGRGSSTYATRARFLAEPPSVDTGEITDKGYINQRAVLTRRAALVEAMYRDTLDDEVITLPRPRRRTAGGGETHH